MRPRSLATTAAIVALLAASSPARAQVDDATRSAARTLAEAGLALEAAADYAGALAKFDRALALVQVPTLGLLSARCLVRLGHLVEASERYRQVRAMRLDPALAAGYRAAQIEAQAQAERERAELVPRIPVLEIALQGADPGEVELFIDQRPVPPASLGVERPMDLGPHRIEVRRGADIAIRDVVLHESGHARITLALPPRAPGPPAPASGAAQRTVGAVMIGVGGAALVGGGVTWALARGKKSSLDALCVNQICPAGARSTLDAYDTLRAATIGAGVAGGALLGAGLVTLLVAPSGTAAPRAALTPFVGPAGAGVRGAF